MDIHSYNFILNSGTTFWFILCWFFAAAVIISLDTICSKQTKGRIVLNYLKRKMFFSFIIRLFFESYLELATSSFIGLKRIDFT